MLFLREGLLCLESPEKQIELFDLVEGRSRALDIEDAGDLKRLVRGVDGVEAALLLERFGAQLVERRDERFDRVLRRALTRLDAGFAWAAPTGRRSLIELCEVAHSLLRHARQDLDQLPVLPETAARRALMLRAHCQPGARVALVGDDDLIAPALAALGLRPTVLDLDPDLLAIERLLGQRLGLEIELRHTDLRDPLPAELVCTFDAFCTDPESTRECVGLFLARGTALVKPGGTGLLACAEEWSTLVDEALLANALRLDERLRRFGNYRDPLTRLASYRSDLYRLGVTSESKPLVAADEAFTEQLFTFGLTVGDHLVGSLQRIAAGAGEGPELLALARDMLGELLQPQVKELRPLPVRVVVATTPSAGVQLSLRADGRTVDVDLWPAPASTDEAQRITRAIAARLAPAETRLTTLRRIE